MREKITTALLKKLKPADKQYEIWDTELKGFLVKINVTGSITYYCQYAHNKKAGIGRANVLSPVQAREIAIKIMSDWSHHGIAPKSRRSKSDEKNIVTLNKFIENEYSPWVLLHRKTGKDTIDRLNRCFAKNIGKVDLTQITPQMINEWSSNKIEKGRTSVTINRDIAALRAVMSKAIELGFITDNPLKDVKQLKTNKSLKVRYLLKNEEQNLRKALDERENKTRKHRITANKWRISRGYAPYPDLDDDHFTDYLKPIILLSLNTGMRRGEIFQLKWNMINFEDKLITIPGEICKSGNSRYIPINKDAFDILTRWYLQNNKPSYNTLIFSNKDDKPFFALKTSWRNLLKNATIENFRWHDMRHHFASKLVMAGVDLNTVRELLGHSDIKMTLRYAHLAPEHKARAVEKLVCI